ncbi:hypothetical protein BDV26DRAFT_296687 [Aspergillus bertholletiae]|uniref:Uncharacterized protein n=1 Tax=Aspergillus bertholletiae TaxID=1226010 RepID=A0A5N7AV28_9EURO|nr:hypothetical protein BDV26DRAFT_296687 [Aspergillus bertholletiae]
MANDHLPRLRQLMKRYHIQFDLPGDPWPEVHVKTFDNIQKLGQFNFDTYCAGVSIWLSSELWKEQIKTRAEWLSRRTERLFGQERNEAGWRFELENDVLMRFSAEVAWQKSKIEATFSNNPTKHTEKLEERRKTENTIHELGTDRLFDSRVQEFVVYDDLLKSQLPKQAPDRVIGLQCTKNFDNLLSSPIRSDLANSEDDVASDILQVTPFQSQADPLLFPFLLLEAKSETSPSGFDAILVQLAFPIYTLLRLQEDLRSSVVWTPGEEGFEPLFDEVLVMSGADLELLEKLWTNTSRSDREAQREEFYVVMGMRLVFHTLMGNHKAAFMLRHL